MSIKKKKEDRDTLELIEFYSSTWAALEAYDRNFEDKKSKQESEQKTIQKKNG